ncbi:MAG: pentapeptide repeat-containing protein [Sphaerochaetaceae bacterium]|nr:pentapeptide repeat-containing protein [Sphaerochaetaceae bacterium]
MQFVDCNLKNADFRYTERDKVSFKYSNFEEAIF